MAKCPTRRGTCKPLVRGFRPDGRNNWKQQKNLARWANERQGIIPYVPVESGLYLLYEDGNNIVTEAGDKLITE